MTRRSRFAAIAVAGALALSVTRVATGAESSKTNDDWENRFNGHEMWLRSLDDALARSAKERKPLLIDFYSHT